MWLLAVVEAVWAGIAGVWQGCLKSVNELEWRRISFE